MTGDLVAAGGLSGERVTVSPPASDDDTALITYEPGPARWWHRLMIWHWHRYTLSAVSYPSVSFGTAMMGQPYVPVTCVLYLCPCLRPGHMHTEVKAGRWTLDQARGVPDAEPPAS